MAYLAIVCTKPAYPLCFLIGQPLSEGFIHTAFSPPIVVTFCGSRPSRNVFVPISLMAATVFFASGRQNLSNANAPQNLSTPRHISFRYPVPVVAVCWYMVQTAISEECPAADNNLLSLVRCLRLFLACNKTDRVQRRG